MKRKRRILIALVSLLVTLLFWWFFGSKYGLKATNYVIATPKLVAPIRVVQLTDLHNSMFGEDNARLVKLVKKQQPDIIVLTGDMLNGDEPETGVATRVIEQLTGIAPVYASYGNHEMLHEQTYGSDMAALYGQAGAHVLERGYADVTVNGQKIRLGGFLGYGLPERYTKSGEAIEAEYTYIEEMQKTEDLKVLLCHYPTCWIKNGLLNDWDVDIVFSGHEHGGQIRLPWLGGVYAPDRGFFPGHTSGVMVAQDGKRALVISRGLGSTGSIPRLNNVPEIVVVDIQPKRQDAAETK